ncbi:helix-turn-helix domain-containing protein [Clostridium sp. CX1]|uniref:helix-turn-helix domain-containing protein n=1 Tax=Clostridium sp. CX1 TaxID=2978346 RepID=UPI0021BED02C|nr:helix-turn-helix domain-containing protein [Clostridium sp. CX1]MCT8978276.1 helix-turn-helix domain-containing protein [Clostridium sp. CX1]
MRTYTVKEVAEILKVTPRTVRKEIDENKLTIFRAASEIRVTEVALMEYMNIKANRGMTEREAELEEENKGLREELSKLQSVLSEFKTILLKI